MRRRTSSPQVCNSFRLQYPHEDDLMINDFVYKAVKERVIVLFDSFAKRTFIHVEDAADCYIFTMKNFDRMRGGSSKPGK